MTGKTKKENLEALIRLANEGMEDLPKVQIWERTSEEAARKYALDLMAQEIQNLPEEDSEPKQCPKCKKPARVRAKEVQRTLVTLHGAIVFKRNAHYCESCKEGFFPRDIELGLPSEGDMSPELEARVADFMINETYGQCELRWELHYSHLPLSANAFRGVAKRLGHAAQESHEMVLQSACRPPEASTTETLYIMNDGSMVPMRKGWNEVKVGVLFRSEHHTRGENSVRGCISAPRFVAVLGGQKEFKHELDMAIELEKGSHAKTMVWLADGARGNWTLASTLCPTAVQILDWYHAVENGMKCGRLLLGEQSPYLSLWKATIERHLIAGDFPGLLRGIQECSSFAKKPEQKTAIEDLIRYYTNNRSRMHYEQYLARGFLIGSGPVESAQRHVIQCRMKRAGQHWGPEGGREMARMRAAYRTAGPRRFCRAVRWAHRASEKIPAKSETKRRASNR